MGLIHIESAGKGCYVTMMETKVNRYITEFSAYDEALDDVRKYRSTSMYNTRGELVAYSRADGEEMVCR